MEQNLSILLYNWSCELIKIVSQLRINYQSEPFCNLEMLKLWNTLDVERRLLHQEYARIIYNVSTNTFNSEFTITATHRCSFNFIVLSSSKCQLLQ